MNCNFSKPYPELPNVLGEFEGEVRKILPDNLVGIYMVGSLATGDFDLDSDVDFVVVIKRELKNNEVTDLQNMHLQIYVRDCYPAKHLEGSYIPIDFISNKETILNEKFWYLDNGSRTLELSDHDNRWHVHWVLREKGIPLYGPEPKTFVNPIPVNELKRDVLVVMDIMANGFQQELHQPLGFYNSRFGQSYIILTYCRILHTLSMGRIESKKSGAEWAKNNIDNKWKELIEQAWQERKGVRFCTKINERANQELLEKTFEFVDFVINETNQIKRELTIEVK